MYWNLSRLRGYALHARDGAIGHTVDILFDDAEWVVRHLVVDTGGWLFGRRVVVPMRVLGGPDAERREIAVQLSREQIKNSPDVDTEKPVSRQQEGALYGYYGWEPYWRTPAVGAAPGIGAAATPRGPDAILPGHAPGDPHLRSGREVVGYAIHCRDRTIGKLDDLVLDERGWGVRHLVVDCGTWLSGRKALVPVEWIEDISWADREVRLALESAQVGSSPEPDDAERIDAAFEERLFTHYGPPPHQ